MSPLVQKVTEEALGLPVDARIGLVEQLLESLNPPPQPTFERLWAEECERRVAEIERGEVELVPAETVFGNLRAKYGE
jgi:putative addiction module component (TIGR02574 family)